VTARAFAALALGVALASGGCVHYPTVMEAGGTMVRPDKGRLVRQGEGAAVYFDLKSSGKYGDVITAVHTPVARQAQLVDRGGSPLSRVEVPGATVMRFTEAGPHVLLSDLTRPLVTGDTIIVTLVLEKMGGLGVIAIVE
jgi:copper(I)-binding protein